MGGGAMLRGMARAMGATMAGAVAINPSSSTTLCHAPTQEPLNVSPVLNLSQKEACGSFPAKPVVDATFMNPDDLENSSDEDWGKLSYNHLVFSPAPSEEEVEEATKELHAALHLSIPTASPYAERSETAPMLESEQAEFVLEVVDRPNVVDKPLPTLSAGLGFLAAGSSSVYQAFHLLQTNTQVQDAVKSLARDPAVWKAVLSNEKVQELTRALHDGHGESAREKESMTIKNDKEELNILKLTSKVCDFVTGKVLQILDKVVEIVSSIFSSVEKTFFSKENMGNIDKTLASCMMLAVAVLLVVAVKRVGKSNV